MKFMNETNEPMGYARRTGETWKINFGWITEDGAPGPGVGEDFFEIVGYEWAPDGFDYIYLSPVENKSHMARCYYPDFRKAFTPTSIAAKKEHEPMLLN